ncbi:MAG: hypothetical protein BWZ03_00270 [bacterium ADurb.BinA186]|nr:MAG: hypothetical protein BWZ03_00270 [bacterium ADurb.BinA186]
MEKITFLNFTWTNVSAKASLGILAGMVLFFGGVSLFNSWNRPNTPHRIAPTVRPVAHAPIEQPAAQSGALVNSETPPSINSQPIVVIDEQVPVLENSEEHNPLKEVVLVVSSREGTKDFTNWEAAKDEINLFVGDTTGALGLSIKFPKDIILASLTEPQFRQWLSRVGDYIFAKRLLLNGDLGHVLRNTKGLMRTPASLVHERGCALFAANGDTWEVTIRGLEEHADELIAVLENIFERALNKPQSMTQCKPLKVGKMSDILVKRTDLSKNQKILTDALIKKCTLSTDMMKQNINSNLAAFLPLTAFIDLLTLKPGESTQLNDANEQFLENFTKEVLEKNINKLEATAENLEIVIKNSYDTIILYLKNWLEQSKIDSILLNSLFND